VRLRRMLAAYRAVEWPLVPAGPSLRSGSDDPRVVTLRKRLGATGASSVFDHDLETLVRHFQSHHGIVVDGIVGPETLAELNVPASQRAQQIAVNMERWRWMPKDPGARHILVNVAAFRVDIIEGARSRLSMNAVVGKEFTKTPFFAAKMTDIVLNPWWNVPDSIARKELWPKQQRDSSYFAREHMVVTNGRIRQRPGPWNALGRIKFNLPNRYDVYLHDTPSKSLFERAFRAFSHGCIRVQKPRELALLLLDDQPQWTPECIDATIEAGVERSVPLTAPVPVFVLYWTALVGDDGHMEFYRDHYGEDAAIAAALQ
jgi:murein L,D-transpeptidase YcbB/YkuD